MIRTERLLLRPPRGADVASLYAFLGDAEAMRYTHADGSPRACRRRVLVHEWARRRDGCAPWLAATRHDGRVVGWGGLYRDPFEPGWGFEIGYFFRPDAWGQGYASELVRAALAVADHELGLVDVFAMAHPDNPGSCRVLEKAGFRVVRALPERSRLLYRRERGAA